MTVGKGNSQLTDWEKKKYQAISLSTIYKEFH